MAMLITPHIPLQQLAVTCVVNLIFHGHIFPDRVFLGDPHAVQSPLGLLNVVSQLSASPSTSQFAIETLFNLSLYRASCLSALRAGGAEILYTVVSQLCKLADGNTGGASSRFMYNTGVQAPGWTSDLGVCMKLLGLAAETLANFSAFVEYHNAVGSHGIKSLSLMLSGALRDVGNLNTSVTNVDRFRCTTVSCSRALVNFSSNAELRRQNFAPELIYLATKLALMDHQRYVAPQDARVLLRNAVRSLCNLSFEATCRSVIIPIPYVLTMLNALIVLPVVVAEGIYDDLVSVSRSNMSNEEVVTREASTPSLGGIMLQNLSDADPVWYLTSSYATTFPWTAEMSEDVKEDALVTLLSLAQEAALLNTEKEQYQALNLAFDDDRERFLASIFHVANELMDSTNIELVVALAFCAATLYHLCASNSANQRILRGLINCCNSIEECQALLACSAAFAITSFTAEGCQQLVECEHLARAFNRLGRSSHVECQQYAAIAACNVSTVACVWSSAELKDFIVVALLRANSIQTKQIHAKTLSNLLSHGDSRAKVVDDGVLYALMKLSQVILAGSTVAEDRRGSTVLGTAVASSTDEVFSIGLRALFNLSCDHQYHSKLLSNGIMAYLSAAVEHQQQTSFSGGKNKASGTSFLFKDDLKPHKQPQRQCVAGHLNVESRRLALTIICNLTSYERNHKELIRAQVTEIICSYADADIESRVSAAMALRNLSCCQPWVEMLCERKILQLLIFCMECEHPAARQFAVEALANFTIRNLTLSVTGHQMLFYDKREDQSDGASNQVKEVQAGDANGYDRDAPVSLMLERHMLHGIKYFQDEIKSGQASERILMEASAAIANLSTIKVLRVAMVRLGVVSTLLEVLARVKTKEQSTIRSRSKLRPIASSYALLGRICAATLHRLVVEEEATVDARSQLVPSLLSTLRQTDEDLQQQ
ncbi:hypothetical protein PInf_027017 [Phytophthora infestans]|nr:hypothetical protein PInf_027017 [Phytophthora infestans]